MWIRITDAERWSRGLGDEIKKNWFSISAELDEQKSMEFKADRNELLLRLNDYEATKKSLDRKVSERQVIVKALRAPMM